MAGTSLSPVARIDVGSVRRAHAGDDCGAHL
jgi:hypothetical protein